MEDAILQYGYLAVFLIAAIEGEAALVAGAVLAQRGHLSFGMAVFASFAGTFLIAEVMYHLARLQGRDRVLARAGDNPKFQRVEQWLERRGNPLVFFARFLWGIRIWIPVACGVGGVKPGRFLLWNVAGALFWTALIAPIGYYFGEALETLGPEAQFAALAATGIAVLAVMWGVIRQTRN